MFEDLKQGNGPTGPNVSSMPNTPKAPVADMFADVDPNNSPDGLIKPSAVQSGKIKPVANNNWQAPDGSANNVQVEQMLVGDSRSPVNRKIIVMVSVIILLIAFGAAAYFIFKDRINGVISKNTNVTQNTNVSNTNVNRNQNTNVSNSNVNANANTNLNQNTNEQVSLDDDSDGLDNETEIKLGTNIRLVDSDNDGLSDWDEVKLYKTDPLKSDSDNDKLIDGQEQLVYFTDPLVVDTDKDGYSDGEEVLNGYNPKGSGKLASTSTIPGLIQNVNNNVNSNVSQ